MTIMIPQDCVDSNPVSQDLFQSLYDQLGPGYKIIQHLKLPKKMSGSLLWVQFKNQSLFIYLSDLMEKDLSFSNKEKSKLKEIIKNKEIAQILAFQQQLLPKPMQQHKAQLAPFLIIFSKISKAKLNIAIQSLGLYLLGKESLQDEKLGEFIYKILGESYSKIIHNNIRHIFSPETLLSKQTSLPLSQLQKNLLDNEQEVAMKADLVLPKEKRRIKNYNLTGINGSASSGKTEALIKRTKLFRENYPDANMLILCTNKTSKKALEKRYAKASPNDNKTEIFHLYQWCKQLLKLSANFVCVHDINEIIEALVSPRLKKNGISMGTFLHELDFIYGRAIFYEKDYLRANNVARPYHLNKEHLPHIWKAALTLKSELSVRGWLLWASLPQLLWDALQKDSFANYDQILIDDAQHFPPIAFELIKKLIKPKTGQLFITQDPNQGIINPCVLWKDTGLDLRGHSTRLNHFYSINPYILNAASAFYLNRLPEDTDKYILQNLSKSADNMAPELLHFHSSKDEENRLINEIKNLIQNKLSLQEILVITPDCKTTKSLESLIKDTLKIPVEILDEHQPETYDHREGIGICNFLQSRGVVAPYVFIFGLQHFFELEKQLEVDTNEYQNLLIENTRKISTAMTCAREKLTLFITAESIPDALKTPHIKIPTDNAASNAEVRYLRQSV